MLACASGGLATAMSEYVVSGGGAVYGAAYTSDFRAAEYIRAQSNEDLETLRSSKYIRARLNTSVFELVTEDLSAGKLVLFVGLPCDIGALKQYIKKKNIETDNLITVDLICHGPTPIKVHEQFVDCLEKKYRSKLKAFSVRYKKTSWTPPYLYAEFENGKTHCEYFYDSSYGVAFSVLQNNACTSCAFKGANHAADITIGDFWGVDETDSGYNAKGTSVALVHNQTGEDFLMSLRDTFYLYEAELQKVLMGNPMYDTSVSKNERSDAFRRDLENSGLAKAVKNFQGLKKRIFKKTPAPIRKILSKILK